MASKAKLLVYILIGAVVLAALMAYFVKPKAPATDLVLPAQELPDYHMHYPGDTGLANRVSKSYGLALVLVRSPFTQKNAIALEYIRAWARDRFQHDPDFLHPVYLEPINERRHTLIEALVYNLFTAPRYALEDGAGEFLKFQIDRFHQSRAYASFRTSYFDLFGWESDSADLLARYESDKAKLAEGPLLWFLFWLACFVYATVELIRCKPDARFERMQRLLAYLWLLLAPCYLARAWIENRVSVLVSALVCAAIGLYLRFPFTAYKEEESGRFCVKFIDFGANQIALTFWLSFSMLAIQILTWIKTGSIIDPDPLTLLLCSVSGNFLHDPIVAKRIIGRIVAILWVVVSFWTAQAWSRETREARDAEAKLASLQGPAN